MTFTKFCIVYFYIYVYIHLHSFVTYLPIIYKILSPDHASILNTNARVSFLAKWDSPRMILPNLTARRTGVTLLLLLLLLRARVLRGREVLTEAGRI